MTEHSEEGGEGLSEAEVKRLDRVVHFTPFANDHDRTTALIEAVERILADRLAAVQAETVSLDFATDAMSEAGHDLEMWQARAESAEAALTTARREADDLRARLGEVEARVLALADEYPAYGSRLRAALASPTSHAQREAEVGAFDGGRLPHDRAAHQAADSFWHADGCPRCSLASDAAGEGR